MALFGMPVLLRVAAFSLMAAAAPALAQTPSPPPPADLVGLALTCQGSATWSQRVTDDNNTIGNFQNDKTTTHARSSGGVVQIRFDAGGAAYKVSGSLPEGGDSWRKVTAVATDGDMIVGRGRMLMMTVNIFKIDRRSGEIEMSLGGGRFSGLCKKAEAAPQTRQF